LTVQRAGAENTEICAVPDRVVTPAKLVLGGPQGAIHGGPIWVTLEYNWAFAGIWDEGTALAENAIKLTGPALIPATGWGRRSGTGSAEKYQEAYKAFQLLH
jgi:hypothetical protein